MKTVNNNRRVLVLLLVIYICALPALSMEGSVPTQTIESPVAQNYLVQFGSQLQFTKFDCSHLVHSLYERVGLHYQYATSRAVYRGIEEFQRVVQPRPGDLVVWRGHMGIVVDPSQHSFFSALRNGVKISSYISEYWKHRGSPRFFRFALSAKVPEEVSPESAAIPGSASTRIPN